MSRGEASIAYCIPTYNRAAVIQQVFDKIVDMYQKYQIDIYIYDSSEGDETRNVVTKYKEDGYTHIEYIRLPASISGSEKSGLIFSGYGFKRHYDYIWPVKDRTYFSEDGIQNIVKELHYKWDVLFLTPRFYPLELKEDVSADIVYNNSVEFFGEWGWVATSLESALFRYGSTLKNIDWQKFKSQDNNDWKNDWRNVFAHFAILFNSLAKLENPAIKVLVRENIFNSSALTGSSWNNDALIVWADLWPKAVRELPCCYNRYKNKVIKQTAMLPWLLGSHRVLIQYRYKGALDADIFSRYRSQWKEVSDIPIEDVDLILMGNDGALSEKLINQIRDFVFKNDYLHAILLYSNNPWLSAFYGKKEFDILGNCFLIYKLEMLRGVHSSIFQSSVKVESLIERYCYIKYFMRRVEYGIVTERQCENFSQILQWRLTEEFLSFVIIKECLNKDGVVNKLNGLSTRLR